MFKLNLTSYILLIIGIWFFFSSIKQCSIKKDYEKAYAKRTSQYMSWENEILNKHQKEILIMHDSIKYFKELLEANYEKAREANKKATQLENEYNELKNHIKEIPYDSSYTFLKALYEPTDTLEYPFAGNQVSEIHLDILEGIKCKEINYELNFENFYLDESLKASGGMNVQMQKENELLEKTIKECQVDQLDSKLKEKTLKRKLWTNRGIAGVAIAFGVIALL